jgi:translocation and assembly module TamA
MSNSVNNKKPKFRAAKSTLKVSIYGALFSYCVFHASPLICEPRALFQIDQKGELVEKIKLAIGEVDGPSQSPFEARNRAEIALKNATDMLRSEGYYQSTIEQTIIDGSTPKGQLKIKTGPRFKIGTTQIEWEGGAPNIIAQKAANEAFRLEAGNDARAQDVIDAEARALGAILSQGYANATTLPKEIIVDHQTLMMNTKITIKSGEIVKFGDIELVSKNRINKKWLESVSRIKAGENFDPRAFALLERRLLDTGAFDNVNIALAPKNNEKQQRNIIIGLQNRARFTLENQISYTSNDGIALEGSLSRYNLLGRADTFITRVAYGNITKRLEAEFRLPHYHYPDQTLALALGSFQDDTNAYRETGNDAKAEITRKLSLTSYWTLGLASNFAHTREPSYLNPDTGIERDYVAINLLGALSYDRTNNNLNSKEGYKADLKIEPTNISGDANISYLKMVGQTAYFLPLDKKQKTIFAARARVGSIMGGKIPELPSGRRLYAGGGGSVRGYAYQAIGPIYNDANSTPVGGLSLIEGGLEIRRDLWKKIGIVAFVDGGNLGIESTPDFSDIKFGAGFGLRYDLGFAPLRFDIGFPIEQVPGESNFQIYIGVGQSF